MGVWEFVQQGLGNEILVGKVKDSNSRTCSVWGVGFGVASVSHGASLQARTPSPPECSELRAIGWTVAKVVMVPDEVAAIAKEVAALSR